MTVLGAPRPRTSYRRRTARRTSLFAHGEPMVWLTGGALATCLIMVVGLLGLVLVRGTATFWPARLERLETLDGRDLLGEVTQVERWSPEPGAFDAYPDDARAAAAERVVDEGGSAQRTLLRTGNFESTGTHFHWVEEPLVVRRSQPEWALLVERRSWGRFYGLPVAFLADGEVLSEEPQRILELFQQRHEEVLERIAERQELERGPLAAANRRLEQARLAAGSAAVRHGADSAQARAAQADLELARTRSGQQIERLRNQIDALDSVGQRYRIRFATTPLDPPPERGGPDARGQATLPLADIVRAFPANRLGLTERIGVYLSRWGEFLSADPREANSEGGVFPAIFGTVLMTLIMSILVVPFGVLAALYLHEYAKQGFLVGVVRIAVNNLAGVPSIVFGVFGLGFFCYIFGASIDDLLFADRLPNPTYGKGGILWASLTLALLTLPVVIVATEESLAAVPGSMREGSFACGATRWQTIRRIILPRAMPGILTGTILAIARGAGEVAPLMLVGAVKLAPELPVDFEHFPYVFPQRSFMHLGFHIYDVGFQSQNSEAARPMVFTTTLLLITIVVLLNVGAMWVRARLRRRFQAAR